MSSNKVAPVEEKHAATISSEKHTVSGIQQLLVVEEKYADVTLRLVEDYEHTVEPLTPEKETKLKRKLYLHVVLLVLVVNLVLFVRHPSHHLVLNVNLQCSRWTRRRCHMRLFLACSRKQELTTPSITI